MEITFFETAVKEKYYLQNDSIKVEFSCSHWQYKMSDYLKIIFDALTSKKHFYSMSE